MDITTLGGCVNNFWLKEGGRLSYKGPWEKNFLRRLGKGCGFILDFWKKNVLFGMLTSLIFTGWGVGID